MQNDILVNGQIPVGVDEFVIWSKDVITLSVKALIIIPVLTVVLWIIFIVVLLLPLKPIQALKELTAHEAQIHQASAHKASAHEASAHEASAHEASAHEASTHRASAHEKSNSNTATYEVPTVGISAHSTTVKENKEEREDRGEDKETGGPIEKIVAKAVSVCGSITSDDAPGNDANDFV